MKTRALIVIVATLLGAATTTHAQTPARGPGDELTVFLATMGPGRQVYELFGHNAIWIHDASSGITAAYNYGLFDDDEPNFLLNFVKGRMMYQMGISEMEQEIYRYTQANRTLQIQRLNLSGVQKDSLRKFLEWNWLEDNRTYLYDYFRDNCSTRVRDALDRVLGGQIRNALTNVPTGTTFASHSYRLTGHDPLVYTGLMVAFGFPTARPIDAWDETFVPERLMHHVRAINITDDSGAVVPLVIDEQTLFEGTVPVPPADAPARTLPYLIGGLIGAFLIVALARAARTASGARVILAIHVALWAVVTATFGFILAMIWLLTDHQAAHQNLNLLLLNPIAMILALTAPSAIAGRGRLGRLAAPAAIVLAALAMTCLLLKAIPGIAQDNGPLTALVVPIHVAVAYALYYVSYGNPSSRVDMSAANSAQQAA